MPRLEGYRERLYANLYDAARLNVVHNGNVRMFGNANIGVKDLTNMTIGGQMAGDATLVLVNVYTRTNMGRLGPTVDDRKREEIRQLFVDGHSQDAIGTALRDLTWERTPLLQALEEWAHTAVVDIVIGNKPMFTMNFFDLLDGPALGPDRRHGDKLPDIQPPEHEPWRRTIGRPIIVPVRQNISVTISSNPDLLKRLTGQCLVAGVMPEPLAWVHLEGLLTREIY